MSIHAWPHLFIQIEGFKVWMWKDLDLRINWSICILYALYCENNFRTYSEWINQLLITQTFFSYNTIIMSGRSQYLLAAAIFIRHAIPQVLDPCLASLRSVLHTFENDDMAPFYCHKLVGRELSQEKLPTSKSLIST